MDRLVTLDIRMTQILAILCSQANLSEIGSPYQHKEVQIQGDI